MSIDPVASVGRANARGEAVAVAVVIPARDEARTIRDVAQRALAQSPLVIVVDDGSGDGTSTMLGGLALVVLRNDASLGKAGSLRRGAEEAMRRGAGLIVTLDGDGQHAPEDIPKLVAAARAAPGHLVIGSRLHQRDAIPAVRYWANRIANFWVSLVAGHPIADTQSGFRAYPAALFGTADVSYDRAHSFVFESEILIEAARLGAGAVCEPVTVSYSDRTRTSHFRPVVDSSRIARMLLSRVMRRALASFGSGRNASPPHRQQPLQRHD